MESNRPNRAVSLDGRLSEPQAGRFGGEQQNPSAAAHAIARTRDWLLAAQHADGHWVAELEGDTILESEYILLLAFLGRHTSQTASKVARYLLEQQLASGGWTTHPGGRLDISVSVKAYFALKLTGHDRDSEPLCARPPRDPGARRRRLR